MMLYRSINLDPHRLQLVCFVGAGGKTTSMFQLAKELRRLGKKVLVTTTTAIYYPSEEVYDNIVITKEADPLSLLGENKEAKEITVIGKGVSKEKKLLGLSPLEVDRIFQKKIYDIILVEGDGSKRKPIKAPNSQEPVIPKYTKKVVGVIGLDALGEVIDEKKVHRPHLFCNLTNSIIGEKVDKSKIVALITHGEGLFKNTPITSGRYLLLNKAKDRGLQEKALEIVKEVKETGDIDGMIVGNMKHKKDFIVWSDHR